MRVLLGLGLAAVVGCHGPAPTRVAPRPPGPAATADELADPLALLPADSDLVFRIDLAAARRSPLWSSYGASLLRALAPEVATCPEDPLADLATITAGITVAEPSAAVIVLRGLDRDKLLRCLRTSNLDTRTRAAFDGDVVTLTNKSGAVNLLTFANSRTAVVLSSDAPTKQRLRAALTVGAPLRHDAAYLAAEARLAPGAVLAFLTRPGSAATATYLRERIGVTTRYVFATFHVTDRVVVRIVDVMASPDAAASFAAALESRLDALRQMIAQVELRVHGETIEVEISATQDELRAIYDLVASLVGSGS